MSSNTEELLLKKRRWISRWPKKAVFLSSGGLDSTITINRLLEEKRVEIFPLFINRGQTNIKYELKSALYFEDYFTSKYKGLFHSLQKVKLGVPPKELKDNLRDFSKQYGYPLRNTILQEIGVQYAASLRSKGIDVRSIFCAQVPDDPFPHSSLESLRATTYCVCQNMGEWDWQITSPNIDPYLYPVPSFKVEMIQWAAEHKLPMEKTRSCYTPNENACGVCLTCKRRKEAFFIAKIKDPTIYTTQ